MTTYVLTVSTTFPSYHPRKCQSTNFPFAINRGFKIHTIRGNYELWRKRFEKIEKGEAMLSLRYWSGKPYKSKQVEFKKFFKTDGIGLQKAERMDNALYATIDNKIVDWGDIAKNDGLSFLDFCDWFSKPISQPMAVIHFTNFRY